MLNKIFNKIFDPVRDFYKIVVYHTPKEKLNKLEIENIKSNGLIHFCNRQNIPTILKEGVKGGLKPPLVKAEKNYTWYYIYDITTYEKNKRIVHSKGERKSYDAYVIIKELKDEQMNKLRIRRKYDNAVIYPGTLKTKTMDAHLIEE